MDKNLYPLQFTPVATERPWGKENWLLADLGYIDSEVLGGWLDGNTLSELMQTYLEKMVGDDTFEYYGLQFPVSVKVIDFDGQTPVFVHADDTVGEQRYDSLGRTALWKVVSAEPGAKALLGFRNKISAAELYAAGQAGQLPALLNEIPVRAGDALLLEPGVPYAFSGKAKVIEIAEASSLVFDLTDPEDLVEAFDFVGLEGYKIPDQVGDDGRGVGDDGRGGDTPHFRVRKALGPEEGEASYVIHIAPDGSSLTLYPAEGDRGAFPQSGIFVLPGASASGTPTEV